MKHIFIGLIALLCLSCTKTDFDFEQPHPFKFAAQLKNRTYNQFEFGENGQKLWAKLPAFQEKYIDQLLELAKDTTLICPCGHFPVNPASSIRAYRLYDGASCMMMGEYLLWIAEGIACHQTYGSLTPTLLHQSNITKRLSGREVLTVRDIYVNWSKQNRRIPGKSPLEGTDYQWR